MAYFLTDDNTKIYYEIEGEGKTHSFHPWMDM